MPRMKKTALVISGGGAKGAFAVGVVKHIHQAYRTTGWFRIAGGTSTGALIAPLAAVMAAPDPMGARALATLVHLYSNVSTPDILEKQNLFELLQRQDCLYESDPLNDLLHRHFLPEWFAYLQSPEAPDCYVVYTNYQDGEKKAVSPRDPGMDRERFIQAMRASASVPVIMEATLMDDQVCFDGGVRDLLPFSNAIALEAETILPIFLDPEQFPSTQTKFRRLDKVLLRTLAILVDEALRNDVKTAELINIGVRAKADILRKFKDDPTALKKLSAIFDRPEFKELFGTDRRLIKIMDGLRPDEPLTEDSLTFEPAQMRRWMDLGEQKAREVLKHSPFV